MSPLQERALAFVMRVNGLTVVAECTDGRHLIVRGHGGLYYVAPDGRLSPCDPDWSAEEPPATPPAAQGP